MLTNLIITFWKFSKIILTQLTQVEKIVLMKCGQCFT